MTVSFWVPRGRLEYGIAAFFERVSTILLDSAAPFEKYSIAFGKGFEVSGIR